jgi:signal peptidase II
MDGDAPAGSDHDGGLTPLRRLAIGGGLAAAVLALDQLSKRWALAELSDGSTIDLVWTLRFNLAFNTGMAFSRGAGWGALIGVLVIAIVAVLVVVASRVRSPVQLALLGVVIGGALGNLVDRALRVGEVNPFTGEVAEGFLSGAVVDFIDLQWWPIFNVADAAVVVGGIALALVAARTPPEPRPASGPAS